MRPDPVDGGRKRPAGLLRAVGRSSFPVQNNRRADTVGLALTILQRRLA